MLKFVLCDDNEGLLRKMSEVLESIFMKHSIEASIVLKTGQPEAVLAYTEDNNVDVLFLDIELKKSLSGLDVAKRIREKNKNIYFIFLTCHFEYAMIAYKVKTFDFLVKPVTYEKLEECVLRVYEDTLTNKKGFISIKSGFGSLVLNKDEIIFIEKKRMKTLFHLGSKTFNTYGSLEKLAASLPENFVRCHKSYIVNIDKIINIAVSKNCITLKNSMECSIGPKYKKNILEVMKNGSKLE